MDYTSSNSYAVDAGTGQRMHLQAQATPTAVSDADLNGVMWELLALIKAAGIAPAGFDKAAPGTYTQVRDAVAVLTRLQTAAFASAGGTANALTGAFSPAVVGLVNGMTLYLRAASANTVAAITFTPAVATIAAKAVVKRNDTALDIGDIAGAGHWIELTYDAILDKWVLLNPASSQASSAKGGYFTSASVTEPKLELHKNGVFAFLMRINATGEFAVVSSNGLGVASGLDIFGFDSNGRMFLRDQRGPAAGNGGRILLQAIDNVGVADTLASLQADMVSGAAGAMSGGLIINLMRNGALIPRLKLSETGALTSIQNPAATVDAVFFGNDFTAGVARTTLKMGYSGGGYGVRLVAEGNPSATNAASMIFERGVGGGNYGESGRFDLAGNFSSVGSIMCSGAGGFAAKNYAPNARNPIYYFGDSPNYGISYFQGTAGSGGSDSIGIHFGTATGGGSTFRFTPAGELLASLFTGALNGNAATATTAANALGVGQTWQNMTGLGGRAVGTNITNNSGRSILVSIYTTGSGASQSASLTVGGVLVASTLGDTTNGASASTLTAVVPNNTAYVLTGTRSISSWVELR